MENLLKQIVNKTEPKRSFSTVVSDNKTLIFPYIKMYGLKCRLVTETENITNSTSKNGSLMRRDQ